MSLPGCCLRMRPKESSHRESDTDYVGCALSFRSWGWLSRLHYRLKEAVDGFRFPRDQSGDTHCILRSDCGGEMNPAGGRYRDIGRSKSSSAYNTPDFNGQYQFNNSTWEHTSSWGDPSMTRAIYSSAAYAELGLIASQNRRTLPFVTRITVSNQHGSTSQE
jgi:hypothetical protein